MSDDLQSDRKTFFEPDKWLLEEYKIIQSKIDKFGEDRFKVRSWCVTLVSGLMVSAKLSNINPLPILLSAFVAAILFNLVEQQQRDTQRRLGIRACEIEDILARNVRAKLGAGLNLSPQMASRLARYFARQRRVAFPRSYLSKSFRGIRNMAAFLSAVWEWCVSRADNIFYVGQYCMISVAALIILIGNISSRKDESGPAIPVYISTNLINVNSAFSGSLKISFPEGFSARKEIVNTNSTEVNQY